MDHDRVDLERRVIPKTKKVAGLLAFFHIDLIILHIIKCISSVCFRLRRNVMHANSGVFQSFRCRLDAGSMKKGGVNALLELSWRVQSWWLIKAGGVKVFLRVCHWSSIVFVISQF